MKAVAWACEGWTWVLLGVPASTGSGQLQQGSLHTTVACKGWWPLVAWGAGPTQGASVGSSVFPQHYRVQFTG